MEQCHGGVGFGVPECLYILYFIFYIFLVLKIVYWERKPPNEYLPFSDGLSCVMYEKRLGKVHKQHM
jgi:hypothetical protein